MYDLLHPIETKTPKEIFIERFEQMILSGQLIIGQKLPPERELAEKLKVSRPVVHEGLLDLASKGLVTLVPRVGSYVNDFRKHGSLGILTSLLTYHGGNLDPKLLQDLLEMRMLIEVENARLAAENRSSEQLDQLEQLLVSEQQVDRSDIGGVTRLDYEFHHLVALGTQNFAYALLLNSFKEFYTHISAKFFADSAMVEPVFALHRRLVDAIRQRDREEAAQVMRHLLAHGAANLARLITTEQGGTR